MLVNVFTTFTNMTEQRAYDTLSEAVNDLQRRGYKDDLILGGHCLLCKAKNATLAPDDLHIDEFYRFEGATDPSDQSIVYAISSAMHGIKGVLVNGFGPTASAMTQEMVEKLATH